jgi:hypothetical protein
MKSCRLAKAWGPFVETYSSILRVEWGTKGETRIEAAIYLFPPAYSTYFSILKMEVISCLLLIGCLLSLFFDLEDRAKK